VSVEPIQPQTRPGLGLDALQEMRISRRKNRLLEMEWFDALYRVYLTAFLGGGFVLFVSGLIKDTKLDPVGVTDFSARTPQMLGVAFAAAFFLGLRTGANGGPIAVEDADVRHVLLAPISRSVVLRHPVIQKVRSLTFVGVLAGAAAGQLIARRLPGEPIHWVFYCAIVGGLIGALFIAAALIAHTINMPFWATTIFGGGLLVWQIWAALGTDVRHGPANAVAEIAVWPLGVDAVNLVGALVILVLLLIGVVLSGRLSIEALARRSNLVAQLKFAVTLQDIRTVVLLRRQLGQESMRSVPWWKIARVGRLGPVMRRGLHSYTRFPARRIIRMVILVAIAAIGLVYAYRGTAPAVVVSGLCLFVLGLELVEPMSQEVDQPERNESFPVVRGQIMRMHLVMPALMLIPFAIIGGVVAGIMQRNSTGAPAVIAILAIPIVSASACGAVINTVKGMPDPLGQSAERLYMPPEVSGLTTVIRSAWPPAVSILACTPVLIVRSAEENGMNVIGAAIRGAVACSLAIVLIVGWVHQRDVIHKWWRDVMEGGRAAQADRSKSEGGLL